MIGTDNHCQGQSIRARDRQSVKGQMISSRDRQSLLRTDDHLSIIGTDDQS